MIPQEYDRQDKARPLFPGLQWARPESKHGAGKLLIIGGTAQGFSAPGEAFGLAETAGIGTARVLLPDVLSRTVGRFFPEALYAPSNPSGGFATRALDELLTQADWADAVLLAGDMGRNSETQAMLETFLDKYHGPIGITRDAADAFCNQPTHILERQDTLLVITMGQLQRLGMQAGFTQAFTSDLGIPELAARLSAITTGHGLFLIVRHHDAYFCAVHGRVSMTARPHEKTWRLPRAAHAAVWWLQNPSKPFEALTTSLIEG